MSVAWAIATRVASQLRDGEVVNLGVGIPTRIADCLERERRVVIQTENGMLGVGHSPAEGQADPNLINAGKLPVTELPGASYFSSSQSFGMIRGAHLDVAVLGRVANWSLPGRPILGVGGAMDLLVGARRVIVATTHLTKAGEPKIVATCSLPLTARRPANLVVTECAMFMIDGDGLVLTEVASHSSLEWVRRHTSASFRIADDLEASRTAGSATPPA